MNTINEEIKTKIIFILKNHDVIRAAVFGSLARNEATEKSDVDILVELPEKKGLLDLVGIKLDLEDELGKKVDVLTYKSLNPKFKDAVLAELELI